MGQCCQSQGKFGEALEHYTKDLAYALDTPPEARPHPDLATIHLNIGQCHRYTHNYPQALDHFLQAMPLLDVEGGRETEAVAAYNDIGACYYSQGNYKDALIFFTKALEWELDQPNAQLRPSLATTYNNVGKCHHHQQDYAQALDCYHHALQIFSTVHGPDHLLTGATFSHLGRCWFGQHDYARALRCHHEALRITQAQSGETHPNTAASYSNIGQCYRRLLDYPQALEQHQKALNIHVEAFGVDHDTTRLSAQNVADTFIVQGQAYHDDGQATLAIEAWTHGRGVATQYLPPNDPSRQQLDVLLQPDL
jgi:tetratricopeptide (TPR) repeat protein